MYLVDNVEQEEMDDDVGLQFPVILQRRPLRRNTSIRLSDETRIMNKRGRLYVYLNKIPDKPIRYALDLWNTLVNMRWRWLLFTVSLVNVIAYLIFAGFFLFDAWFSGDFDPAQGHKTCINGVGSFTTFFMLGIETITTTGYGYFHPTEYCRLVFLVLTCSTLVTIFIDGAFISVVYVKISRPAFKLSKSIFSKKAVISLRNRKMCLIFRVDDRTGRHWINSQIKMFLMRDVLSKDGSFCPNYLTELKVKPHGPILWPMEIVHEITSSSPFWGVSAKDLMTAKFELLVTITGSSVLTGQLSKSQTSYLSKEIQWGYRFSSCLHYDSTKLQYEVSNNDVNKTAPHDTPLCSARDLSRFEEDAHMHKSKLSIDENVFIGSGRQIIAYT